MNKVVVIPIAFLIAACTSNTDSNILHDWKYSIGYHIGDWLSFEKLGNLQISNDTIFNQDTAVAIVIEVDEQIGSETELTLKSLTTGELGTYHKK